MPEACASGSVAMQVRTDQLQLLFRQSFLATFGSVGGALALSWLQRDLGNHEVIAPWLITLCLAGIVRLSLFWSYHRSALQHRTHARWEGVYWVTLVFTSGVWGMGAFLLMSRDNLLSQAITLFFAIGMAGSAISAYSAYRSMTLVAIGLVLLPTTLGLLTGSSSEQRVLAFTTLAFSAFVMRATRELSHALQSHHFKQINDTHGHATGDRVLQAVAQALKTTLREADLCGRLGGEEFGVLLTGTNLHEARQLAEKLRLAIQAIVVPMDNTALRVTISVGVAEAGAACADITTLLAQADAAMYHAKANGRNRVHGGSA